jgi:hypothetical protein
MADRLGFLVIGRVTGRKQVGLAARVNKHASCLGWIVTPEFLIDDLLRVGAEAVLGADGKLVGLELATSPLEPIPSVISFVAFELNALPSLTALELPKLILGKEETEDTRDLKEKAMQPGILGWVQ